jgi:ParB family chromosome partitioning protein
LETHLGELCATVATMRPAMREVRGEAVAERIAHLKKGEMAGQAQDLLAGAGWLPEPQRTPSLVATAAAVIGTDPGQPADIAPLEAGDGTADAVADRSEDAVGGPVTDWQSAAD